MRRREEPRPGDAPIQGLRTRSEAVDLNEDVLLAPEKGNSRQPILLLNCLVSARPVFGRKYARLAANSGPVILPRMVQGAIRTWELFRMRLYFPESLRVIT